MRAPSARVRDKIILLASLSRLFAPSPSLLPDQSLALVPGTADSLRGPTYSFTVPAYRARQALLTLIDVGSQFWWSSEKGY